MMTEHDHLAAARLDGKGFVVLGAGGGGIGTATSLALAQAGAKLLCVDASLEQAEEIAGATGGAPHVADITNRRAMEAVFDTAEQMFGDGFAGVVDIVGAAKNGPIERFDDDMIERQFAIVLRHALLAIQIAGPKLARRGAGTMTFVGSISGSTVVPGQAIYGVAKAALHHLVRYAGQAFGPNGVRSNAVSPAFVRTPRLRAALPGQVWDAIAAQNPLRRVAEPTDIAKAVLYLASPLSSYVNGQVLVLDGGVANDMIFPGLDIPL